MKSDGQNDSGLYNLITPFTDRKAIIYIIVIGFAVYFNMLFNNFVWDDLGYVLSSSTSNALNVLRLFSSNNIFNSFGYYRPLPALYFSILFHFFGTTPFFYHFIQLSFHITNTIFFYFLLKSFFKTKASFIVSLLFLIHPIQVESVSYIAQTDSVLFFLFGICAFLLSQHKQLDTWLVIRIAVLLLLCSLTKEPGLLFIPLIICYRFIFKKGKLASFSIIGLFVLLCYCFIRFFISKVYFYNMVFVPISRSSLSIRLLNIPDIILYYLKTFLFPENLAIMQNWVVTRLNFQDFWLPLSILLIISFLYFIFAYNIYKQKAYFRTYLFFSIWFFMGMVPYLQLIPLDETVADRWFYFPLAGLLGLLGTVLLSIKTKHKTLKPIINIGLILILCFFSIRTIIRNNDWQNALQLYLHDSKQSDSYLLEGSIGAIYIALNDWNDAIYHLQKSVALLPVNLAYTQLGYAYERKGDIKQAGKSYFQAVSVFTPDPNYQIDEPVYENLVRYLLYFDNNPSLAHTYLAHSLAKFPNTIDLNVLLVIDEYKLHNHVEELAAAKKTYQLFHNQMVESLYILALHNQQLNIPINTFY